MRAARQRNTTAEVLLRAELDRLGLSYLVDQCPLPSLRRRADVLWAAERVAVFVDGCFWHGCPIHGTWPKQNADFWKEKIEANQRRDADTDRRLTEARWTVIRVWEHEDPAAAAERIASVVWSHWA